MVDISDEEVIDGLNGLLKSVYSKVQETYGQFEWKLGLFKQLGKVGLNGSIIFLGNEEIHVIEINFFVVEKEPDELLVDFAGIKKTPKPRKRPNQTFPLSEQENLDKSIFEWIKQQMEML